MNYRIVLYVEGETEEEFYNKLKEYLKKKNKKDKFKVKSIDIKNIRSICKFENKLLAKYKNEMQNKYKKDKIVVFLCYDNDVFEISQHPKIDRLKIEKELRVMGAYDVIHIVQKRTIEDWFMLDSNGVLDYLGLNKKTKIKGKNGLEKIKNLFDIKNRIYQKGVRTEGLIAKLDMNLIYKEISDEIKILEDYLFNKR